MTDLTVELAEEIAGLVRDDYSFRQIENMPGMPTRKTIRLWMRQYPDFATMLDNARILRQKASKATAEISLERKRQAGGVVLEAVDHDHKGNAIQIRARAGISCKLDWYERIGAITKQMQRAGYKFAFLHFTSGKLPRTTPMYGHFARGGGEGFDPFLQKTDSQIKLEAALKVLTPAEADVIWDVCGNDCHAGGGGRVRALATGLRALAVHFGIDDDEK